MAKKRTHVGVEMGGNKKTELGKIERIRRNEGRGEEKQDPKSARRDRVGMKKRTGERRENQMKLYRRRRRGNIAKRGNGQG